MSTSTVKLFKALPIKSTSKTRISTRTIEDLMRKTLPYGFIYAPEVIKEYGPEHLENFIKEIGRSPEQLNSSFHKSWGKVKNAPIEQLVLEQIIHYFTTYGFEQLGIYNESSVYIPPEKLDIPEIKDGFKITVIKGYTIAQFEEKITKLVSSGVALSTDTIETICSVVSSLKISIDPEVVKNKEMKIKIYDTLGVVPENPVEMLRYMVYKSTGNTLLIKNRETIEKIKEGDNKEEINNILSKYLYFFDDAGIKLSSIFLRFKPLFLAYKSFMPHTINRLRKLANKYHEPMKEDILNEVTSKLDNLDMKNFAVSLSKANIFRKIRLAYALKYRTLEDLESIQYKIRNGKSFATEFKFKNKKKAKEILDVVLSSIVEDLKKNVKGKKFYIPKEMVYTLPATEKQFTGFIPSGSYVTVPKDMIVGIHWFNVEKERIDLDLSLMEMNYKFGWDGFYRNNARDILFSGDMTSAPKPKGASELFYIKKQSDHNLIMSVNLFNYGLVGEVPFSIVVGHLTSGQFGRGFMLDPNSILVRTNAVVTADNPQKTLGLLSTTSNESRFYFNEATTGGRRRSARSTNYTEWSRKYMIKFYSNMITLEDLLLRAGAKITRKKDVDTISLAPEDLEKDTILNLLK